MRLLWNFSAVAIISTFVNVAGGQTLLDRIEGTLKSKAAQPASKAAVPASNKGYLGFTPDVDTQDGKGVLVLSTKPGAPAEAGGLKKGDLITAVDGKKVTSLAELDPILEKATVGQSMKMTVDRGGKVVTLNLTMGRRPAPAASGVPASDPPPAAGGNPPASELAAGEAPLEPASPAADSPMPEPAVGAPSLEPPVTDAAADPAAAPAPAPIRSRPLAPPAGAADEDPAAGAAAPRSIFDPLPPASDNPAEESAPGIGLPADPTIPGDLGAGSRPSLGITVLPLTEEARSELGVPVRRGALITAIRPGSAADLAGLPIGGVVVALDGRKIDSAEELVAAIRAARAGQEVELTYYDREHLARKSVRLAPTGSGSAPAPLAGAADPSVEIPPRGRTAFDPLEAPRRGPSTVYDPSEMAALRDNVLRLEKLVQDLQDRLDALEGKGAAAAPRLAPPADNPPGNVAPLP